MAVVLVHQGPTVTRARYEETVRKLTGGKDRLDSPSDWPVEGIVRDHRSQEFPEVDDARWMTLDDARNALIAGQQGFLDRLLAAVA